jgi:hypothetical protein
MDILDNYIDMADPKAISTQMYSSKTTIQKKNGEYKITVKSIQEESNVSFYGQPLDNSEDIAQYAKAFNNICRGFDNEPFSYLPFEIKAISEAIKHDKVYAIMDKLICGKGIALTILQRCHRHFIEVSIPIFFCIFCNFTRCEHDCLNYIDKHSKREILLIEKSPVRYTKPAISPPSN